MMLHIFTGSTGLNKPIVQRSILCGDHRIGKPRHRPFARLGSPLATELAIPLAAVGFSQHPGDASCGSGEAMAIVRAALARPSQSKACPCWPRSPISSSWKTWVISSCSLLTAPPGSRCSAKPAPSLTGGKVVDPTHPNRQGVPPPMASLCALILTYNESKHLRRCIGNLSLEPFSHAPSWVGRGCRRCAGTPERFAAG